MDEKKRFIEIILKKLTEEEENESITYWDNKLLEKGDKIKIGFKEFVMPFQGFLVFVDLEPKANWGHRCLYFLIDSQSFEYKIVEGEFPPYLGKYPESYKVILRYGKTPPHDRDFSIHRQ